MLIYLVNEKALLNQRLQKMSSEAANFEFWRRDSINGPDYSNIGPQKSLFERAMPKLTIVLTILVTILLPLAISNNIEINKTKGE